MGLGARMAAGPGGRVWVPPQWAQGRLGLLARAAGLRAARDLQDLHRTQAFSPVTSQTTARSVPVHRAALFRGAAGLWQH